MSQHMTKNTPEWHQNSIVIPHCLNAFISPKYAQNINILCTKFRKEVSSKHSACVPCV